MRRRPILLKKKSIPVRHQKKWTKIKHQVLTILLHRLSTFWMPSLLHKMMKHGLIGLSSGDRTVRFRPHLAITDADTDKCLELTAESLKAL